MFRTVGKTTPWSRGWFEPDRLHGDRPGGRAGRTPSRCGRSFRESIDPDRTSDPSDEATATPRSAMVSFGAGSYSVDEGGTVEVTVQLDGAPGRDVVVPVSAAGAGGATPPGETGADWSGVPENVTFGATDTAQTFTLAATDDTDVENRRERGALLRNAAGRRDGGNPGFGHGHDRGQRGAADAERGERGGVRGQPRGLHGDVVGGGGLGERRDGELGDVGRDRRHRHRGQGLHGGERHADSSSSAPRPGRSLCRRPRTPPRRTTRRSRWTLSDVSANAQLASDPTAKGTITDLPTLSVADVLVSEASGIAEFVVTLSRASEETVTVGLFGVGRERRTRRASPADFTAGFADADHRSGSRFD